MEIKVKCAGCHIETVLHIERWKEPEVSLTPKDWIRRHKDDSN